MSEIIKIDKTQLAAQINRLQQLHDSTKLEEAVKDMYDIFTSSSGTTSNNSSDFFNAFEALSKNMDTLFKTTLDFLENKHGDFVKADS